MLPSFKGYSKNNLQTRNEGNECRIKTNKCGTGKFSLFFCYNISNQFQRLEVKKSEDLTTELLRMKNNFNLRGALGKSQIFFIKLINARSRIFSWRVSPIKKLPRDAGKTQLLEILVKESDYGICLKKTMKRYQLRKNDINNCSPKLYHELSKHAHTHYGNMWKLAVRDTEHTIVEVAAFETVFSTLKNMKCFNLPLTIEVS